jgi:hypothetical protein
MPLECLPKTTHWIPPRVKLKVGLEEVQENCWVKQPSFDYFHNLFTVGLQARLLIQPVFPTQIPEDTENNHGRNKGFRYKGGGKDGKDDCLGAAG